MRMTKQTIDDVDLSQKRVLVRVDYNVPLENNRVADDTRIRASLPTIKKIIDEGGTAILMSHLGRPKGSRDESLSLRPVAEHLSGLIDAPVEFVEDTIGDQVRRAVDSAGAGNVIVLENTRFYPGEKANDDDYARELAALADVYVNDAFGAAHRAHASTNGIAGYVPHAVMGYLMKNELDQLSRLLESPEHPFVAVLGGAKVSDKIGVIEALLDKVDTLLIGGGMTYTFLKSQGISVGNSLVEDDKLDVAAELLGADEVKILLPDDHRAAESMDSTESKIIEGGIPADMMGLDIGPQTIETYGEKIRGASTVVWNGPMGVFEKEPFAQGTFAIAGALADAADSGAYTVVGGGDSVAAVNQSGYEERISHVSTGGGAMLTFLEGNELPGVAALNDR